MPIKRRNCDMRDGISGHLRNWRVSPVSLYADYWVQAVDVSTLSAGDFLTLRRRVSPQPMNLYMRVNDAGNAASITLRVDGLDQFGEAVTDTVTVAVTSGGSKVLFTTKVFARVDTIKVTAVSGATAGDSLVVGHQPSASLRMGFPVRVVKNSSWKSQQEAVAAFNTATLTLMSRNGDISTADFTLNLDTQSFQHALMAEGDEFLFAFDYPWGD